jgi:hypothetical protein
MKTFKIFGLIATLLMCTFIPAKSHDYNTGIGVRGGFFNGLTIKHFISDNVALEGLFTTRWGGFGVTGLYEIHKNAFDVPRLHWYYGLGGHVGFYDGRRTHKFWGDEDKRSYTVIGADFILGLEYNFQELPINLSVDWKPAFNFYGYSGFWFDDGAFSIRFIF